MIAKPILELLSTISLNQYIRASRSKGRGNVERSTRQDLVATLERVALAYASAANLSYEEERLSNLVNDILASERALLNVPRPRYPSYTNINVLNRFIGVYSNPSIQTTWAKCRLALAVVIDDWLHFERDALTLHERASGGAKPEQLGRNFQERNVKLRIERLELPCSLIANVTRPKIQPVDDLLSSEAYPVDWLYYAIEHDGAVGLAHLTALPQSDYHDEYLFLRTIHLTEICLWAIITGIRAATQAAARGEFSTVLLSLRESNFFAEFLVRVFSVFKTMPVESFFNGFREATGNASAIQSEQYQHLEILSRGMAPGKRSELSESNKLPELAWLADWQPRPEATLAGLVHTTERGAFASSGLLRSELYRLDRSLHNWRHVHFGIAREYLPGAETVGTGEQGIPYLERSLRTPALFESQSVSAASVVRDAVSRDAIVSSREFSELQIGFIVSRQVKATKLIEVSEEIGKQADERLRALSHQKEYPLSRLFRFYDPIFARYGAEFPLRQQLASAMRSGLTTKTIPRLLLSLELSSGLLMGLHDGSQMKFPIRVITAVAGQEFVSFSRKTLGLRADELVLADETRIFASYVQGPDKRTSIDLNPDTTTNQVFKTLVFVVFGAPGLPEADFGAGLVFARTAAFALSGEPEEYLVKTQYA